MNEILGIPHILAYDNTYMTTNRMFNKARKLLNLYRNKFLIKDIESHLELMEQTNNRYIVNAIKTINKYYNDMCCFIKKME